MKPEKKKLKPLKANYGGATQDWREVLKGATPEAVAEALLKPQKPLKPPPSDDGQLKDRI